MRWKSSEDVEYLAPIDAFLCIESLKLSMKSSIDSPPKFLEIGVWKGGWIRTVCDNVENCTGVAIDPYPGLEKVREIFIDMLKIEGINGRVQLFPTYAHLAWGEEEINKFNIIHIDGVHSEANVLRDLSFAEKVLKRIGVIVIDDFYHASYPGVLSATMKFIHSSDFFSFMISRNKLFMCRREFYDYFYAGFRQILSHSKIPYLGSVEVGDFTLGVTHTYATANSIKDMPQIIIPKLSEEFQFSVLGIPKKYKYRFQLFPKRFLSRVKGFIQRVPI